MHRLLIGTYPSVYNIEGCIRMWCCVAQDPIKPHERRALNFLTHEYLMQQDFKLTAITLTEENEDQVSVCREETRSVCGGWRPGQCV